MNRQTGIKLLVLFPPERLRGKVSSHVLAILGPVTLMRSPGQRAPDMAGLYLHYAYEPPIASQFIESMKPSNPPNVGSLASQRQGAEPCM